jgi:hypothetical protein
LGFKDQMFGFSNLEDFAKRAKKQNSKTFLEASKNSAKPIQVRARLRRVKDILGPQSYNIITNNCQHKANYVTLGKCISHQATNVATPILVAVSIGLLASGVWGLKKIANCVRGTCHKTYISNGGCSCIGNIYRTNWGGGGWKIGDKYCEVNKKICKTGQKYKNYYIDKVTDLNAQLNCVQRSNKGNLKYKKCGKFGFGSRKSRKRRSRSRRKSRSRKSRSRSSRKSRSKRKSRRRRK